MLRPSTWQVRGINIKKIQHNLVWGKLFCQMVVVVCLVMAEISMTIFKRVVQSQPKWENHDQNDIVFLKPLKLGF